MKVYAMGLSHKTAPLETRERVALTGEELPRAIDTLSATFGDVVILSTCNRTEVYSAAPGGEAFRRGLMDFLRQKAPQEDGRLSDYVYFLEQEDAVRHLFRVASGLDSMILGEAQVLGQVREAYSAAVAMGCGRGHISKLFHHALRVGKRARSETRIGENALSISSAAVETAKRALGDIRDKRVMVVGAGEAGKLVARAMKDRGAGELVVVNRTLKRAQELARELEGGAVSFEGLEDLLGTVDIVVSSTDSQNQVLSQAMVARALGRRNGKPLLVVDIALPRDADPAIGELPGVSLMDMDDLQAVSQANRRDREREAVQVEEIVDAEVVRFREWWGSLRVAPGIARIREQAETVRQLELRKTLKQMPHISVEDTARLEAMSKAIVKKLLHNPITTIKENPSYMEAAQELFGMDGQGL